MREMMRAALQRLALPLAVGWLAACASPTAVDWPALPPNVSQVPYVVLEELTTHYSGIHERQRRTIRTPEEWTAFWDEFEGSRQPRTDPPSVDFAKQMVLVAAMGGRPTGGYTISVEQVYAAAERLIVRVLERSPGRSCIVIQVLTAPVTGVLVPRSDAPVEFQEKAETVDCS